MCHQVNKYHTTITTTTPRYQSNVRCTKPIRSHVRQDPYVTRGLLLPVGIDTAQVQCNCLGCNLVKPRYYSTSLLTLRDLRSISYKKERKKIYSRTRHPIPPSLRETPVLNPSSLQIIGRLSTVLQVSAVIQFPPRLRVTQAWTVRSVENPPFHQNHRIKLNMSALR